MNRVYSIVLLIIVSLTSCRTSKQLDSRIANRLQKKIDSKYYSNPESIGILVHLEHPKENLKWSGAVGYSNKESKTKLNLNQPILIASNTKTFVSAAVLRLVEPALCNRE